MQSTSLEKRDIYDPVLRLIHAVNALAIVLLMATGYGAELVEQGADEAFVWDLHMYFGYALIVGLAARLAWGLVGPDYARFSDMWHPASWFKALSEKRVWVSQRFGHDELASAVYLVVYALLLVASTTGLALAAIEHDRGPLARWLFDSVWWQDFFEEPHELVSITLVTFVAVHFAALLKHQIVDGDPLARSMITGEQFRPTQQRTEDR